MNSGIAITHTSADSNHVRSTCPPDAMAKTVNAAAAWTGANQIHTERDDSLGCMSRTVSMIQTQSAGRSTVVAQAQQRPPIGNKNIASLWSQAVLPETEPAHFCKSNQSNGQHYRVTKQRRDCGA